MQEITIYLRTDSVNAKVVDAFNQTVKALPAITRGLRAVLILKLLDGEGNPVTGLDAFVGWDFVLATDWLMTTPPQIRASTGITVDGNEIRIPLTETNTEELIAALGNQEAMTIGAELVGFEPGESVPGYLIQFDMQVRNRRSDAGSGSPTPVSDGNYSAAQIDTILANYQSPVSETSDLDDWSGQSPRDRQIPVFDEESGQYVPSTPAFPEASSDLSDWSDVPPDDGQVPVFDSASGKYVPTTLDLTPDTGTGGNEETTPSVAGGIVRRVKICATAALGIEKEFSVYAFAPETDSQISFSTGSIDLSADRVEFDLEIMPKTDLVLTFPNDVERKNEFPDGLTANCSYLFRMRSLAFGWLGEFLHVQNPPPPISITQNGQAAILIVVNANPITVDFGDGTRTDYPAIEGADGDIENIENSNQIQHNFEDASERTIQIVKGADSVYALIFMAQGLSSLDVSKHRNLSVLGIVGEDSTVTELNVSVLPKLQGLLLQGLPIESLDVGNNPLLRMVTLESLPIAGLDISSNPLMFTLELTDCQLTDAAVNDILAHLAAGSVENGTFTINQATEFILTEQGEAARQTLLERGWEIDVPIPAIAI